MKLLVLAHTPPPVHGQSVMVRALVTGLPERGIPLRHINLQLSRTAEDIGRWRPGKAFATLSATLRAVLARFRDRCDTLYYVPAPPEKRGALFRDWTVMLLCRPFYRRVILHWHAVGLGEWLDRDATRIERWISHVLLGRTELAIVLADSVRPDAENFRPRRVALVANGIPDPGEPSPPPVLPPFQAFFLGQCSQEKGLIAAAEATVAANRHRRAKAGSPAFVLKAAGAFDRAESAFRWKELADEYPEWLHHVGVVDADRKRALFATSHALILPTQYSAEGLPLVAIEALAHDRPIIATAWRGLPDIVTPEVGRLVPVADPKVLAEALLDLSRNPPTAGACRARFLQQYTLDEHLDALQMALMGSEMKLARRVEPKVKDAVTNSDAT